MRQSDNLMKVCMKLFESVIRCWQVWNAVWEPYHLKPVSWKLQDSNIASNCRDQKHSAVRTRTNYERDHRFERTEYFQTKNLYGTTL